LILQLRDVNAARGAARDEKRAEKREHETRSLHHCCNPQSKWSRPGREQKLQECGDASACLKLRIPVTRRDRFRLVQNICPRKSGYSACTSALGEDLVSPPGIR
jgi:hypothetical protein